MPSRFGVFAMENDRVAWCPGTSKSMYWPGKYLISWLDQSDDEMPHVVRDRFVRDHLDRALPEGQTRGDHLLVVVEELDDEVLVGVGPAEQRQAFLLLEFWEREGRVAVEFDVLAVQHERLAGGALALLAAVHERDALLGRGAQDGLVRVDLDLDADRLEPDGVLLAQRLHLPVVAGRLLVRAVSGGQPSPTRRGWRGRAGGHPTLPLA
jgi:hypothetical protein